MDMLTTALILNFKTGIRLKQMVDNMQFIITLPNNVGVKIEHGKFLTCGIFQSKVMTKEQAELIASYLSTYKWQNVIAIQFKEAIIIELNTITKLLSQRTDILYTKESEELL